MSDESLRLAAEVVDKYSGPLREMQKALRRVADEVKGTHAQGTAYAKKHQEAVGVLSKEAAKFEERLKSGVTPALAAVGITTLSVAGAIAVLKDTVVGFADTTRQLTFLSRETGLTINQLRVFDAVARRLGTTPEAMHKGFSGFAQHIQNLRRMAPEELNTWRREWDANANLFLRSLANMPIEQAVSQALGFLDRIPTQQDKRKWLRMLELPENFANLTGDELRKAIEDARKNIGQLGPDAATAGLKFQEAIDKLAESIDKLKLSVGTELAGAFADATDKIKEFVDENRSGLIEVLKSVSSETKVALDDLKELSGEFKKLKAGDFSDSKMFGMPHGPLAEKAVGAWHTLDKWWQEHSGLGHKLGIPGFATGGVVPRDMLAMVHKSEIVIPAGGGFGAGDAIKKPVKEGTAEGTRKGVFEGMRDWFELNEGGAGGAGGGRGGGGGPGGAGTSAPSGHGAGFGAGGAIDIMAGGGTRGNRNNNRGNLKYGPFAKAHGATGADDRGFAIFPDQATGDAAHAALIKQNYGGLTLDQFGNKYSEGSASWKNTVGKELGIGRGDVVDVDNPKLLSAIRKAEGTGGDTSSTGDVFGRANFAHGQFGGLGENLTKVTTAGGHHFTVNAASAPYFKNFVEHLERGGAPLADSGIGGYVPKKIAGTNKWSQHAFGNALDVMEQFRAPGLQGVAPGFRKWIESHPQEYQEALRAGHIYSGERFGDAGHYEYHTPKTR